MCNPSKKTIKRVKTLLSTRCYRTVKTDSSIVYLFRNPIEQGLQNVVYISRRGLFLATELTKADVYHYFEICSPEQMKEVLA